MHPVVRPRRLRRTPAIRDMVRETRRDAADFIYPLFVRAGKGIRSEISSMPGNFHFSVDRVVEEVGAAREEGIRSVILCGIPERKDETGSEAHDDAAAVQSAVRALKKAYPDLAGIRTFAMIAPLLPGAEQLPGLLKDSADHVMVDRLNYHYADAVYKKYGMQWAKKDSFFRQKGEELRQAFEKEGIPCQVLY